MLPIITKFVGPSRFEGSRVHATNGERKITVSKSLELHEIEAHWEAAQALLVKMDSPWRRFDWAGYPMQGDGYVFVPVLASAKVFEKEG